ncbi:MAG: isocitrate lyase/phosphoenolpyruvate mutase family protein [Burkholderiaceae bacterium]
MPTQAEKALTFRALHQQAGSFIIPNPWDAGTARILASLGFKALASTSAGYAFSLGQLDNTVARAPMMQHLAELAAATGLPLNADLGNGFGDSPEAVVQAIALAAAAGVVGGSIEDSTQRKDAPVYPLAQAAERIRAASEAARALPFAFTLTARAENYFIGKPDLADTIARLQAYQEAGADVLYAPGLKTAEDIAQVLRSVDRPVNVLMGTKGFQLSVQTLTELGVKRISTGGSLALAALGAFVRAAKELQEQGSFGYADEALTGREIYQLLRVKSPTAEQY